MTIANERPVVPEDLYRTLATADRVVVKESPMQDAKTLFESTDKKDLEELRSSLVIEKPEGWLHCMCIGTPALYLFEGDRRILELTNHHGLSVRCSLWSSDAPIGDTEKWLSWFDEREMPSARREVEEMRVQQEQDKKDWDKWLAAMPKAIKPVWSKALGQFGSVDVAPLKVALEKDIPGKNETILALLEWFGSGAGPWSGFPSYEAAAEELLLDYPTKDIVAAVESRRITAAQTEGAARLFAGRSFQQQLGGLKEVPSALKRVLWNHVKGTEDQDKLGRAKRALAE